MVEHKGEKKQTESLHDVQNFQRNDTSLFKGYFLEEYRNIRLKP